MHTKIYIEGRQIDIDISERALTAITQRQTPITAVMELYFSCLLRKRVLFEETVTGQEVVPGLHLQFKQMMTRACRMDEANGHAPDMTDFPIVKKSAFVPHWLKIDYQKGQWIGEFGYK